MCHQATCSTCRKATWFGCGSHVPAVMDPIPEAERCGCEPTIERAGKVYPPMGSPFGGVIGAVKGLFGYGPEQGGKKDEL